MCARAVALCCALLVAVGAAAAYTVDCNHEYTDCDTELSKMTDDDELPTLRSSRSEEPITTTSTSSSTATVTPAPKITEMITENKTDEQTTEYPEVTEEVKPKPRLLNLNVDELQNFANALHNQSDKSSKKLTDLSDVTLDDDDDDTPRIDSHHNTKDIADKFYSNLQAPFHPLISGNRESEDETCREDEVGYKIGEKIDRGCEETCECTPGGNFDCSPRCKHPYIRRGRRLNDPLCFESPVDDCCSIIACSTDQKPTKVEVCKYGNETHAVGTRWYIGCETTCSCEPNSVVTCKPRCKPISPSEKCINVQDPNDACCEVQVCDVSQDDHELAENTTSTTTTTGQPPRSSEEYEESRSNNRPLVLAEPIGSIKVLQNNSVQVNLMHPNNTNDPIHLLLSEDAGKTFQDVELKYSNLILNLQGGKDYILKTKETGTKFNFTITTSDAGTNGGEELENHSKVGCYEDGKFYEIGEEFRIGCTELCECTGADIRECVALMCPNHVGLEIMSKGCVKWAPSPPAQPPNCCPRSARCLSDGTCHYNGVPVPNWSEVPISLTGCEQRCFCENGDLDCQEVCTPLPPVPPQALRCPPLHRPAPVNISDEDCCKQWGCLPNGTNGSQTHSMPVFSEPINYVTPISPILPKSTTQVLPPPFATDPIDLYKHLTPFHSFPKFQNTVTPVSVPMFQQNESGHVRTVPIFKYDHKESQENYRPGDNITIFTLGDIGSPFKTIQAGPPLVTGDEYWPKLPNTNKVKVNSFLKPHISVSQTSHTHPEKHVNFVLTDNKVHDIMHQHRMPQSSPPQRSLFDSVKKLQASPRDSVKYFTPTHTKIVPPPASFYEDFYSKSNVEQSPPSSFFEPAPKNKSDYILSKSGSTPPNTLSNYARDHTTHNSLGKHVTILQNKDLRTPKPTEGSNDIWNVDTKTHVLTKQPNPYETVLLRAIPSPKVHNVPVSSQKLNSLKVPRKSYSAIDLEHLLNQVEVKSEVNRNLGRSADKSQGSAAGHIPQTPPDFTPHKPQSPSFLPTIPPEIHFPQEDIPDYDQNNIHRPPPPGQPGLAGLPPGLQLPPSFGEINKKLSVISIEADSPSSIKMLLGLPPVLVGLRGSVDLRYTDKADEDVSHWYSQVFAPADEVLTTPRLEFRLTGLKPSTTYKVRGKLFLHNLPASPESETYSVRTLDLPTMGPVEEKRREIDSGLTVAEVNDTAAHVTWRHFTEEELQFIDGIQVRYRPVGTPIYSMTELLHHSRSAAELHDLRPSSRYEASLVLIPPPRATTELHDPGRVEFTTAPYIDPYNWTVIIEVRSVGAEAAELTWHGVPSPAERWVRVYRAAHACGENQAAGKEHDEFRLAARDQPPSVTLSGLQPESRCRVWLELFMTNGKVKTSNVLEINTKSLDTDNPIDNEIEASSHSGSRSGRPRGDYYTALVGVGVVAALGALTSLLLLLVVVRRHRPHSVPITPVPTAPRESSLPPYDNPAYKLELQQETMDL